MTHVGSCNVEQEYEALIHPPYPQKDYSLNVRQAQRPSVMPSKSHTVQLAMQQILPLQSEAKQPDDTLLWQFLGSPSISGFIGGGIGATVSMAGGLVLGVLNRLNPARLARQSLLFAAAGAVLGGGFSAWRMNRTNQVYTAWMDALGSEQATLGDVRRATPLKSHHS